MNNEGFIADFLLLQLIHMFALFKSFQRYSFIICMNFCFNLYDNWIPIWSVLSVKDAGCPTLLGMKNCCSSAQPFLWNNSMKCFYIQRNYSIYSPSKHIPLCKKEQNERNTAMETTISFGFWQNVQISNTSGFRISDPILNTDHLQTNSSSMSPTFFGLFNLLML